MLGAVCVSPVLANQPFSCSELKMKQVSLLPFRLKGLRAAVNLSYMGRDRQGRAQQSQ